MEQIPAPLKGKVALVTGASRGIGAGIAKKLVQHGVTHIAITYLGNKDKAEKVLAEIRELSPGKIKTHAFKADLLDDNFGPLCVEQSLQGLGVDHLDIVIACAANVDIASWTGVEEMSKTAWNEVMLGNAWAPIALAQASISKLTSPGGRIIFISSVAAHLAIPGSMMAYQNSKAALNSAARTLAGNWSPKHQITVNSISVGATLTDAVKALLEVQPEMEAVMNESMFKRIGSVEDVANIVAFVASPDAGWITANCIPANGGYLPQLQG